MYNIFELNEKSLVELKEIALSMGLTEISLPKEELIYSIIDHQVDHPDIIKKATPTKKEPNPKPSKKQNRENNPKSTSDLNSVIMENSLPIKESITDIMKELGIKEVPEDIVSAETKENTDQEKQSGRGLSQKQQRERRPRISRSNQQEQQPADQPNADQKSYEKVVFQKKKNRSCRRKDRE
jgi:Rho termination factor, N-terminal domain.